MMLVYDLKSKNFAPAEVTDFSSNDILERQNIESWVMKHPELLGEELLIITNEYDRFDKTKERLDLLALDKDGKLVIIELKRDDSGKYVDLQAIKYAAYCSTLTLDDIVPLRNKFVSKYKQVTIEDTKKELLEFVGTDFEELDDKPRIMLVSKDFKPEVTASVLWLRKFELDISCIKLTPYKIDNDRIGIVSSILIPLPEAEEFIVKAERKENIEHSFNRREKEYFELYSELIKRFDNKVKQSISGLPTARNRYYFYIPTGYSGIHFEWQFKGNPRTAFGVELHFEKSNKDENLRVLRELAKYKDEIEKELGESVILDENFGSHWTRLYVVKKEGQITEELKEWAVEKMARLYTTCLPKLGKIIK
jgi:hypothetical protein